MLELDVKPREASRYEPLGILDFPLVAAQNTARNLETKTIAGENVYFGTGVVTPKAISQGLPFDFYGMLLTAEWVRQKTGASGIIQEISDAHALENPLHDPAEVNRMAKRQKEQLTRLASALGIADHYRCVLASEYRPSGDFQKIQAEVDGLSSLDTPAYIRYQSAGNLYFARYEGVGSKVGWLLSDDEKPAGFDERTFNNAYDQLGLQPICFVYTWSGWNFDANRPRVSPYTSISGEKRLMLENREPVTDEFEKVAAECTNAKIRGAVFKHLARIVTAYDMTFGSSGSSFWADKQDLVPYGPYVEMTKLEPWMAGRYIQLEKLFQRIDEIRSVDSANVPIRLRPEVTFSVCANA
jgi:hypothetical protein